MMQKLQIGEPVSGEQRPYKEQTIFTIDQSGAVLYIFFAKPTNAEKEAVKKGKTQFGLYVKDEIIFFLSKFGSLNWMDSPYNVNLSPPVELEQPEDGQGYSLTIIFADARNGIVKALRHIGLSTDFSRALKAAVETQKQMSFDKQLYDQKLNRLYASYNTDDMVNMAKTLL